MAKVLAISAHYDDVEIACGGTLLRHRDKNDKITIAVTNCEDDFAGLPEERFAEQVNSCRILGAELVNLSSKRWDEKQIIGALDGLRVDTIYIPYCKDTHQDHVRAFEIGKALGRKNFVDKVFQYISPTSFECYPNYFKLIDFEEKEKLINEFKSQTLRRPDYIEVARAQNKLFGLLAGDKYAEGFNIIKYVEN
jgi:LmbE family N-acetylglucosaminyl deacetylase